jgi:hypothetical protein
MYIAHAMLMSPAQHRVCYVHKYKKKGPKKKSDEPRSPSGRGRVDLSTCFFFLTFFWLSFVVFFIFIFFFRTRDAYGPRSASGRG